MNKKQTSEQTLGQVKKGPIEDWDMAWDMAHAGKPHRDEHLAVKELQGMISDNPSLSLSRAALQKSVSEQVSSLLEGAEMAESRVQKRYEEKAEKERRDAEAWERGLLQVQTFSPELSAALDSELPTDEEREKAEQDFRELIAATIEKWPDAVQSMSPAQIPNPPRGRVEDPEVEVDRNTLTLVAPVESTGDDVEGAGPGSLVAIHLIQGGPGRRHWSDAHVEILRPPTEAEKEEYGYADYRDPSSGEWGPHPGQHITHVPMYLMDMSPGQGVGISGDTTTRRSFSEGVVDALKEVIGRAKPVAGLQQVDSQALVANHYEVPERGYILNQGDSRLKDVPEVDIPGVISTLVSFKPLKDASAKTVDT